MSSKGRRRLLGVISGLLLVSPSVIATAPASAASTCPNYELLVVRGSGETLTDGYHGYGHTMLDFVQHVGPDLSALYTAAGQPAPTIISREVDYPAIPVNFTQVSYASNYAKSVAAGKQALVAAINTLLQGPCGYNSQGISQTSLIIGGYSQGAQVVGDVAETFPITLLPSIRATVLIADPRFKGAQSQINAGNYNAKLNGIATHTDGTRPIATVGAWEHSYCQDLDPVCNFTLGNAKFCVQHMASCPHLHYWDWFDSGQTFTAEAAQWAAHIAVYPGCGFPPVVGAGPSRPNGC